MWLETATIVVPLAAASDDYQVRHVELQLTPSEASLLRRLYDALRAEHVTLLSGRYVQSTPDALRWLLETIYCSEHLEVRPVT